MSRREPHDRRTSPGRRAGLVDEIASVIRERIYSQRYPPAAHLRQEALATELGVSRTPLREAFRLLEQEGLVRVDPHQGARVVSGDLDTLLQAYELRAVLDGLAARLAARHHPTPRQCRELRAIIAAQEAALDPWDARAYTGANVDFHQFLLHMSRNDFVLAQAPILQMTAQVFAPVALVEPETARRAIAEHRAIADAVEAADEAAAEQLARGHIEATIKQLEHKRDAASTEAEGGS
jgi:DNA-binding GntR family transcriptional regulator